MRADIEMKIDGALLGRAATLSFSPALAVAWPNLNFDAGNNAHLVINILRNRTDGRAFNTDILQGILQVMVKTPLNVGPTPATQHAGTVLAHFPRGLWLDNDGVIVRIGYAPPYSGSGFKDQDGVWWQKPVTIPWFAEINAD